MEEPLHLAAPFLEHVPGHLAVPNDAAELEGLLRRVWETGRRPWPQVALPADIFIRHVARRLSPVSAGYPLAQSLEQLALADLYLACACLHRMHAAIATLENHYLANQHRSGTSSCPPRGSTRSARRSVSISCLARPRPGRRSPSTQVATVSRWLKSARQAVYEETKGRLQERLGLTSREFSSLLALIDSQLDLNISQVLKEETGGSPPRNE